MTTAATIDYPVHIDNPTPVEVGVVYIPITVAADAADGEMFEADLKAGTPQLTLRLAKHDGCPATVTLDAYVDGPKGRVVVGQVTGCPGCLPKVPDA